jgi:hypothetical protein
MKGMHLLFLLGCLVGVACSKYSNPTGDCQNQADCNPERTCGDMIQCVDGACDPQAVVELPCDKACGGDGDCPAGMHCRRTDPLDETGLCVADGTCLAVGECQGLAHDACLGSWNCTAGTCRYTCEDLAACADHADCVLADRDCCCGLTEADYVAVRTDKLTEWLAREECRGADCPDIACFVPDTIAAACVEGECQVERLQNPGWADCSIDADCMVATDSCCSCYDSPLQGYTPIARARLTDWTNRPECAGVQCERCEFYPDDTSALCWEDLCLRSVCRLEPGGQGQCQLEWADPFGCGLDADCQRIELNCPTCGCSAGYREQAMHRDWVAPFLDALERICAVMGACAPGPFGVDACTNRPAVCLDGRCDVLGQSCADCQDFWDPVCALAPNDAVWTFPNPCQAACAWGEEPATVAYWGRCECMVDCDCGGPFGCSACASNGQTYGCGYGEIECNGREPLYPGDCDPACDFCQEIDRMPIPVCGREFLTYADLCYANCLGRDYWHLGECDLGEGQFCGGSGGQACASADLFCLIEDNAPGASGQCIRLGACQVPAHCDGQPLETPPCVGQWTCQDHTCSWVCTR